MYARQVASTILSLAFFLIFCSTDKTDSVLIESDSAIDQVQEEEDLRELMNQIRLAAILVFLFSLTEVVKE